ncbi:ABC transporter ATP-binding protein [Oleidesulfovibrio sp.]|uniref:ABC transporter ATP-binding protein n=1 Tax=Oleidesulfovibrio sp. TaxID=2909707 RepID=UPI003A88CF69
MNTSVYRLENVVQRFEGRDGKPYVALSIDRLEIRQGEIVGLAGSNGSGKSTLMRILAFLESPAEGHIYFRGNRADGEQADVRRQVTLLTQEPYLLHRSVAANIGFGLKVRGIRPTQQQLASALERVRLDPAEFLHRQWYQLSGGEAQRVALAARLALQPRVLLLDEPTASLDEDSSLAVRMAVLDERKTRGTTLVIVSHDQQWLNNVTDRVIRLRKGTIEP